MTLAVMKCMCYAIVALDGLRVSLKRCFVLLLDDCSKA